MAQSPSFKVDISEYSRGNTDEILEPGYTWWRFRKDVTSDTLIVDGVKCIVYISQDASYLLRGGWNKTFVQNADYKAKNARLTGDGVNIDPNGCGSFILKLEGLPKGNHSIQTYHSDWDNPAKSYGYPITIKCNGTVVHENVMRTFQEPIAANACLVTTDFTIANDGDAVEFEFSTSEDKPGTGDATHTNARMTPILNGFELNTVSVVAQAKNPYPTYGNLHVDADNGDFTIHWSPANASIKQHLLYIATDSTELENMKTPTATKEYADTTYYMKDLYNLNTYYWRVDEVDVNDNVTKGEMWYFSPRHLAFVGAEGYGKYARGGRGGIVYHVTNLLDDNNPGSFRYGITNLTGPRTIVFDVSGIIPIHGTISCNSSFVTIAGQTAPGNGICFHRASEDGNAAIGFGGNDNIIRYIRNRVGTGDTSDGMGMRGADHSIMDHCSMSWSIDEGFSCRESFNLTLQHSLISEALNVAGHDHYDEGSAHGFAAVFGGDISSLHHNLLANNSGRNPRLDGGMEGDGTYKGRVDYFNNVVYNWNSHPAYGEAHEANFHANYYKMGPATTRKWILIADVNQRGSNKGTESYYYMNNVLTDVSGGIIFDGTKHGNGSGTKSIDGGEWKLVNQMTVDWNPWVTTPFFPSYANVTNAYTAYKDVLSDVGCNLPVQDNHDKRQIRTTQKGTYEFTGSTSGLKGLIDKSEDCGGLDEYPEVTRAADFDTDQDGMPNWFEKLIGSDENVANNNDDPDHDGWTLLEDYLAYMGTPHFETGSTAVEINLSDYFVGYTKSPVFSMLGVTENTYEITGSTLKITPRTNFNGIEYFEVQVLDTEIPAGQTEPVASKRRFAFLATSDPTSIESINATEVGKNSKIYDLNGRLMNNTTTLSPGIYIIDNKKFLIK